MNLEMAYQDTFVLKTLISFFIFYTLSLDVHTIFLFDGHVCVLESKTVHIDC